MSDTKLRPEDLTSEERAIVQTVALNYWNNEYEAHEAWRLALTQQTPFILARRVLFVPAPEKAAKVECPNCGEMTEHNHSRYEGPGPDKWACQPATPEPAAPEMPEAVRDKMREEALDAALNRNFRGQAGLLFVEGYCAAVRQQAAQGRKVEFPKGRELVSMVRSLTPYLSQLGCTDLARSFNDYADASATELDAAEGKSEGRG